MEKKDSGLLQPIANLLIQQGLISTSDLLKLQVKAKQAKQSLVRYLVNTQLFEAKKLALLCATHFGLSYLDLDAVSIEKAPWQLVDETLLRRHHVAPIFLQDKQLILATEEPNQIALKEIQFHTGRHCAFTVVETHKLSSFIEQILHQQVKQGPSKALKSAIQDLQEEEPIVKFINNILRDAINKKASDIHFEPYEDSYRIRYRQDGILVDLASPPLELANRLTARLKILANLDISERRRPQDGRFKLPNLHEKTIDFRVSVCPTINGEKIVLRLLDAKTSKIPLEQLGLDAFQERLFLQALAKPQGLILVTGPTGSGKTITLYTAIDRLNTKEKNIVTAEDPVEMTIAGINQVPVNAKIGLNFATILRALLRQDPDIIMLGEIRDEETAEIAIKAAHTGHLVLSTLHTNSAAASLTRLSELKVSPFNLASAINLLIAQRLIRCLCPHCKKRSDTFYQAQGCAFCVQGYRGRVGVFEVMPLSPAIRELILSKKSTLDIFKQAQREGMSSLYQSGLFKVNQGLTTLEEIQGLMHET